MYTGGYRKGLYLSFQPLSGCGSKWRDNLQSSLHITTLIDLSTSLLMLRKQCLSGHRNFLRKNGCYGFLAGAERRDFIILLTFSSSPYGGGVDRWNFIMMMLKYSPNAAPQLSKKGDRCDFSTAMCIRPVMKFSPLPGHYNFLRRNGRYEFLTEKGGISLFVLPLPPPLPKAWLANQTSL